MKQAQQAAKANGHYRFRGIMFRIPAEELPEAIRESRRFHADLVERLVSQAKAHARLLSRTGVFRNGGR